jgi:hypothetical protein
MYSMNDCEAKVSSTHLGRKRLRFIRGKTRPTIIQSPVEAKNSKPVNIESLFSEFKLKLLAQVRAENRALKNKLRKQKKSIIDLKQSIQTNAVQTIDFKRTGHRMYIKSRVDKSADFCVKFVKYSTDCKASQALVLIREYALNFAVSRSKVACKIFPDSCAFSVTGSHHINHTCQLSDLPNATLTMESYLLSKNTRTELLKYGSWAKRTDELEKMDFDVLLFSHKPAGAEESIVCFLIYSTLSFLGVSYIKLHGYSLALWFNRSLIQAIILSLAEKNPNVCFTCKTGDDYEFFTSIGFKPFFSKLVGWSTIDKEVVFLSPTFRHEDKMKWLIS